MQQNKPHNSMKKYLLIMAAAIAMGFVSYFYIGKQFITKPAQINAVVALQQEQQNAANTLQQEQKTAAPTISQSSSSVSDTGAWGRKLTSTEMAVKSEWMERTGRSHVNNASYEHYSDATLEEMVNKGDIYAMAVLGMRKLVGEGGSKAATPYAEKAIVHGSLSGISTMAIYVDPKDDSEPYEEIKKQLMESQAYYALYAMRGDPYSAKVSKDIQLKFFKEKYNLDNVFDAEDETWITNRAQELYNKYQAERHKLGLGDFDNEMPKEVKTFFDPKRGE